MVGAGPGDPGLITSRGAELLRRADVVYYDYLVNPTILEGASPTAERICLGRHGRTRLWNQVEINAALIEQARQGRTVVRLKSGDPLVFGRGGEEAEALHAAGVPLEIVPGVTAALAAGSHAGCSLTHREFASAVAFVTAHEAATEGGLDYSALASFPGTLVFYMGVTSAPSWTTRLIAAGRAAATPVALVRRCSFADQTVWTGRLDEVVDHIRSAELRPPVLALVGEAAERREALRWFDRRPLAGQRVLIARPAEQAEALATPLRELGADVLRQAAITIGPPADLAAVDLELSRLDSYDWLVFVSANGVRRLLDRLEQLGGDMRRLGGNRLAAIGPGTTAALAEYHLRPDLCPERHVAESLADELAPQVAGRRVLCVRASRGRDVLPERLAAHGAQVAQVVAYTSEDVTTADPEIAESLAEGRIDWVLVTSSAIARSLAALFGDSLRRARLVSISPITSETLRELGLTPAAEALDHSMPGVIAALVEAVATSRGR